MQQTVVNTHTLSTIQFFFHIGIFPIISWKFSRKNLKIHLKFTTDLIDFTWWRRVHILVRNFGCKTVDLSVFPVEKNHTVSSWRYQFAPQVVLISSHTIKFQLGWKEMKTCFLLQSLCSFVESTHSKETPRLTSRTRPSVRRHHHQHR